MQYFWGGGYYTLFYGFRYTVCWPAARNLSSHQFLCRYTRHTFPIVSTPISAPSFNGIIRHRSDFLLRRSFSLSAISNNSLLKKSKFVNMHKGGSHTQQLVGPPSLREVAHRAGRSLHRRNKLEKVPDQRCCPACRLLQSASLTAPSEREPFCSFIQLYSLIF